MATQRHFCRRREPAQFEIARTAFIGHQERGFAEIILRRDGLQYGVLQPFGERHHRRRIALERLAGEGVDLDDGDSHARFPNQGGVTSASISGLSVSI